MVGMKSPTDVTANQTPANQPPNYSGPPQSYPASTGGPGYNYPQIPPANQLAPYPYPFPPPPPPQQQQQQQQQQQVVVVNGNPAPVLITSVESYGGLQAFGCVVFWFFNPLFGLIAWILARECRLFSFIRFYIVS